MVGNRSAKSLEAGGVEPAVVDAQVQHALGDGAADPVARQQLVDEPLAVGCRAGARRGPAAPRTATAAA